MPDYQEFDSFQDYLYALAAYGGEHYEELPVGSNWVGCYEEWVDIMVEIPMGVQDCFEETKSIRGWLWHVVEVDGVLVFFRLLKAVPLKIQRGMPTMIWYSPSTRPPRTMPPKSKKKLPDAYRPVILYECPAPAQVPDSGEGQMCLFPKEEVIG